MECGWGAGTTGLPVWVWGSRALCLELQRSRAEQKHGLSGEGGGGRANSGMRSDYATVLSGSEWNGLPNARVAVTSGYAGAHQISG